MTNHNWQLVSLELAKRMKELGFKQESLWWWVDVGIKCGELNTQDWKLAHYRPQTKGMRTYNSSLDCSFEYYPNHYSAYTVAELGEMLSKGYNTFQTKFLADKGKWKCCPNNLSALKGLEFADTEANARAKMLIYLKGEGLL